MNSFNRKPMAIALAGVMLHTRDKGAMAYQPDIRPIHTRDKNEPLDDTAAQLKTRMAKLDKLIDDHKDRLDNLPEDAKSELETRAKEIKDLTAKLEGIQQEMVDGVNSRGADPDTTASILIRNKNILDQAQSIQKSKGKFSFDDVNARNIVTLAGIGGKAAQLAQMDLTRTVERALTILDLVNFTPVSGEWVPLFRESGYDIMADLVDEGEDKPESDLDFGVVDLKVGTIAHWIKVSKQLIDDMPSLAAYIEGRLSYGVRLKLESKIINGDGKVSGARSFIGLLETGTHIVVTASAGDTAIDLVSKGKSKAGLSGVLPEIVVLNPEDWGIIERIKGSDGHYIFGAPGAAVQPILWGLPVVLSAAMPLMKFWTGNLTIGTSGYVRQEVDVELSTEDGNNFTKNLCTIRAEMRAAFGVAIPDACASGTLPAVELPTAPAFTTNTQAELKGTAQAGTIIKAYDANGVVLKVALTGGNGQWTLGANPFGVGVVGKLSATNASSVESNKTNVVGAA